MPLTTAELIERVKRQLSARNPADGYVQAADLEILAAADIARQRLATQISQDTARRHLLQAQFSLTTTGDAAGDMCAALLTATNSITSQADMLTDSVPMGAVVDSQGNPYSFIPQWQSFRYGTYPAVMGYFCLKNQYLYTRSITNGSFTDDVSPLTVTASFVPRVQDVPNALVDDLVSLTCQVYLSNATVPPNN